MRYHIKRIDRTVELNDELVREYQKHDIIQDSLFMIPIRCMYGDNTSSNYLSDSDLVLLCNECILNELKALDMLPKALAFLEQNYEKWTDGTMQEYQIQEG